MLVGLVIALAGLEIVLVGLVIALAGLEIVLVGLVIALVGLEIMLAGPAIVLISGVFGGGWAAKGHLQRLGAFFARQAAGAGAALTPCANRGNPRRGQAVRIMANSGLTHAASREAAPGW